MASEGNKFITKKERTVVVPSICVFDVNETLLDIEFIAPLFQRLFGDRKVMREWFGQLVLYSGAITLSGPYTTFFSLGQGVLEMLGSIYGVSVQQAAIEELRMRMLTMPAHPDVPAGLKQLKDAGFRLVTLSNSPPDPQGSRGDRIKIAAMRKSGGTKRMRLVLSGPGLVIGPAPAPGQG